MILVTDRDHLTNAMSRVTGIINKANTIPILANVLLTARDGQLAIRSTNMDMEAIATIPAESGQDGTCTVSADKFGEMARTLPTGGQVGLKLDESWLHITCGKSRFKLATLPVKQFPELWAETWEHRIEVRADQLADMLSRVDFAQHPGPSDPWLQGVRLETRDGRLRMIATDRAILATCDGPETETSFPAITIPTRMVSEMTRLLSGQEGDISLGVSDGKVSLMSNDLVITSKLLERSLGYPAYEKVIPKTSSRSAIIPVEAALAGIRRAMIAGQNLGAKGMTVRVTFSEGAVNFTGRNSEADAFDEIEAEVTGDEVTLPLNPPYLIDALSHLGTEFASASFGDKKSATVWRPHGGADALVVIMPQAVA